MRARANDTCVEQYSQRINCAQVKGAVKTMVTVVATQELEAGDVLRRFGAETAQDDPRLGSNNNRCIVVCLVVVAIRKLSPAMGFLSLVWCAFLLLFLLIHACVRVMMIYTAFLVMFSILDKATALACWQLALPRWKRVPY